jgi:hypothetical protein
VGMALERMDKLELRVGKLEAGVQKFAKDAEGIIKLILQRLDKLEARVRALHPETEDSDEVV